jgi:hypothetical protein
MPATVCGVNVFCPSQGLTGTDQGYNGEDQDTLEASQEGPATQGTAAGEFENGVVPDETLDVQSQVMVSASVPFISKSNILILNSAHPCCHIFPLACCSASHKCEDAFSQTPPPSLKKTRTTGADAIHGLSQLIS